MRARRPATDLEHWRRSHIRGQSVLVARGGAMKRLDGLQRIDTHRARDLAPFSQRARGLRGVRRSDPLPSVGAVVVLALVSFELWAHVRTCSSELDGLV